MKHIVITGERGVGKSTLARKLCKSSLKKIYGYCTLCTERDETGMHKVYLLPADDVLKKGHAEALKDVSKSMLVGTSDMKNKAFYPKTFNDLGVNLIKEGINASPGSLILMDEIGFMEKDARAFTDSILRAFDGDIQVIAVLKKHCFEEYADKIRNHPKVALYEVTEENREDLYEEILKIL